jgi:hypothetical protein
MMILNAIEFSFQFSDLSIVSIHLFIGAGPVLVDLVDDQGEITENHEASYAKFSSDTKTMKAHFVFGGVVGG